MKKIIFLVFIPLFLIFSNASKSTPFCNICGDTLCGAYFFFNYQGYDFGVDFDIYQDSTCVPYFRYDIEIKKLVFFENDSSYQGSNVDAMNYAIKFILAGMENTIGLSNGDTIRINIPVCYGEGYDTLFDSRTIEPCSLPPECKSNILIISQSPYSSYISISWQSYSEEYQNCDVPCEFMGSSLIMELDSLIIFPDCPDECFWLITGNNIENNDFIGSLNDADFVIKSGQDTTESIRVKNTGRVIIGQKIPDNDSTALLTVAGKIVAQGLFIIPDSTSYWTWPDNVFHDNYNLMSLPDLETYILKNKHLPEVPSKLQVKNDGIKISEIQSLMLRKVEELTLHALEINKENQVLRRKIYKIKKNWRNKK